MKYDTEKLTIKRRKNGFKKLEEKTLKIFFHLIFYNKSHWTAHFSRAILTIKWTTGGRPEAVDVIKISTAAINRVQGVVVNNLHCTFM